VTNYPERPEALRALRDVRFAEDHYQPIASPVFMAWVVASQRNYLVSGALLAD
jgi:hypothetical protein